MKNLRGRICPLCHGTKMIPMRWAQVAGRVWKDLRTGVIDSMPVRKTLCHVCFWRGRSRGVLTAKHQAFLMRRMTFFNSRKHRKRTLELCVGQSKP
jgi:hypothetical protein